MTTEPQAIEFASVLTDAIKAQIRALHTSTPGVVLSYDAAQKRAQVRPVLRARFSDGETRQAPTITGVPVAFPRGGGFQISWGLAEGDTGLLIFGERSIDDWLALGGDDVEPTSRRTYDLSDAVFLPGIEPFNGAQSGAGADQLVIESGDFSVRLDESAGEVVIAGPGGSELKIDAGGNATVNAADNATVNAAAISISGSFGAEFKTNLIGQIQARGMAAGVGTLYPPIPIPISILFILRDLVEIIGTGGLARIGAPPGPLVNIGTGQTAAALQPLFAEIVAALTSMEAP